MEPSDQKIPLTAAPRGWRGTPWNRVTIVGLLVGILAAFYFASRTMMTMMDRRPVTAAQLAAATAGTSVDVAIEIVTIPANGLFTGNLLEQRSSGVYHRTDRVLRIHWQSDTPVIMGQPGDVRQGAVLQVRGRLGADDLLDADQLVILTGYVTLQ